MDARQRLNQLRRLKTKPMNRFNANPNKKKQFIDLRQRISTNTNTTNDNRISIRSRIGFKSKNSVLNRKQVLIKGNKNIRQVINRSRVSVADQRIPKVRVNLSEIDANPRTAFNTTKLGVNAKNESKRRFNTIGSTTQPMIVSKTSVPTYSSSSAAFEPKWHSMSKSDNNTVLVTNLNKAITQNDIIELFGEIGPIVSADKIDSSVALIVFGKAMDARKACQTYHNRLLDGQPMQCNTIADSTNEFEEEMPATVESTYYSRQSSGLLASQLRQINSLQPQSTKMTAAQAFMSTRAPNNRYSYL